MSTEPAAELATDVNLGLSSAEAARRLAEHGRNELPAPRPRPAWRVALAELTNTLTVVLLAAAVVTAAISHWTDTGVILVTAVLRNATIGFVQEGRAEQALESCGSSPRTSQGPSATAAPLGFPGRGARAGRLSSDLGRRDRSPPTSTFLECTVFCAEEATLTGESEPAAKDGAEESVAAGSADRASTPRTWALRRWPDCHVGRWSRRARHRARPHRRAAGGAPTTTPHRSSGGSPTSAGGSLVAIRGVRIVFVIGIAGRRGSAADVPHRGEPRGGGDPGGSSRGGDRRARARAPGGWPTGTRSRGAWPRWRPWVRSPWSAPTRPARSPRTAWQSSGRGHRRLVSLVGAGYQPEGAVERQTAGDEPYLATPALGRRRVQRRRIARRPRAHGMGRHRRPDRRRPPRRRRQARHRPALPRARPSAVAETRSAPSAGA